MRVWEGGCRGGQGECGGGLVHPQQQRGTEANSPRKHGAEESFVTNFIPTSDHIKTHNSSTNFALTEKCQRTVAVESACNS